MRGGRIAAVEKTILPSSATEVIDVAGKLVLPGLIDTHAHVYQYVTGRFGLNPDMVGVRSGVTTVIDQGGPSCMTLPGIFLDFIVEPAATQVYAFLSAYLVGGLEGHYYPNLYSPAGVDIDATVTAANANKDIVRGIKGHAEIGGFARWGIKVLENVGRDRPPHRAAALRAFRHAVGPAGQRRQRRGRRYDPGTGDPEIAARRHPAILFTAPIAPASSSAEAQPDSVIRAAIMLGRGRGRATAAIPPSASRGTGRCRQSVRQLLGADLTGETPKCCCRRARRPSITTTRTIRSPYRSSA